MLRRVVVVCLVVFSIAWAASAQNQSPVLLDVYYAIGEEFIEPPVEIAPEDVEDFGIYFEYADEDCNLPGGHFFVRLTAPEPGDWQDLGELPDSLGCSTEETDIVYGFRFEPPMDPADYTGETKWTDDEGAESNVMGWEFTVTEGADDDSDDDSTDDDDDISDDDEEGDDDDGGGCGCGF